MFIAPSLQKESGLSNGIGKDLIVRKLQRSCSGSKTVANRLVCQFQVMSDRFCLYRSEASNGS